MSTRTNAEPRARHDLLAAEEEVALARRWRDAGDVAARDRLVACNLRLAGKLARKYRFRGLDPEDLDQWARVGLVEACDRFDPERGFRFTTFATHYILKYLRREARDQGDPIRVPDHVHRARSLIARGLPPVVGGHPVPAEHLAAAEVSLRARQAGPVDADGRQFRLDGLTAGEPEEADPTLDPEIVAGLLRFLPARHGEVIRLRFGFDGEGGKTLDEVGDLLGVSRERIRQIEVKALDRLRAEVARRRSAGRLVPPWPGPTPAPGPSPDPIPLPSPLPPPRTEEPPVSLATTPKPRLARTDDDDPPRPAEKRKSRYRGLSWSAAAGRWKVVVCLPGGKNKHAGTSPIEEEAARIYDRKARELLGDRARLNFPDDAPAVAEPVAPAPAVAEAPSPSAEVEAPAPAVVRPRARPEPMPTVEAPATVARPAPAADPEVAAIAAIAAAFDALDAALAGLDDRGRWRVLVWIDSRFYDTKEARR